MRYQGAGSVMPRWGKWRRWCSAQTALLGNSQKQCFCERGVGLPSTRRFCYVSQQPVITSASCRSASQQTIQRKQVVYTFTILVNLSVMDFSSQCILTRLTGSEWVACTGWNVWRGPLTTENGFFFVISSQLLQAISLQDADLRLHTNVVI